MTWKTAWFCRRCDEEVRRHEAMHNHGTCPHCGKNSGSTIVDTYVRTYRTEVIPRDPKWAFWRKSETRRVYSDKGTTK